MEELNDPAVQNRMFDFVGLPGRTNDSQVGTSLLAFPKRRINSGVDVR
jgi:hypothetical protein